MALISSVSLCLLVMTLLGRASVRLGHNTSQVELVVHLKKIFFIKFFFLHVIF